MIWTAEDIERIKHLFPKPRGTVEMDHLTFFQALHYIAKNGCTWRALPKTFGKWSTIYSRFSDGCSAANRLRFDCMVIFAGFRIMHGKLHGLPKKVL